MDERDYKAMNEELNQPSCLGAVSSSALKLNVANWGWKVLSPENKDKAVALFHRHDDAVQFAVMKWGKYAEWEVKCCDKRIPLHCY
jgi:hypothetical protein